MRKIHDLYYLCRDFARYSFGKDYFHQRQGLGYHFRDERCYYNDLTKKADWTGQRRDGLPVLHLVDSGEDILWPIMVLLYGLGSIDKYFSGAGGAYLDQAQSVCRWMLNNVLPQGCFDNGWRDLNPVCDYYSNNSAMCQGLAISFAVRVVRYELADPDTCRRLDSLVEPMKTNMLAPVDQEGTALRTDEGLFLLEFCGKDDNVVLNGWIYGVFGLIDYLEDRQDLQASAFLKETLSTMAAVLPRYRLPNGWSHYDSRGRVSSPFYHSLHIALLDALYRLTKESAFHDYEQAFRRANGTVTRCRYTLRKMRDKLTDRGRYSSQR
jgi:heparosan-N-sulfate-glucuronate 5-epimerase